MLVFLTQAFFLESTMKNNNDVNTMTKAKRIVTESKKNSEGLGLSFVVILSWVSTTYLSTEIPPEVIGVMGSVIGSFASRIKDQ